LKIGLYILILILSYNHLFAQLEVDIKLYNENGINVSKATVQLYNLVDKTIDTTFEMNKKGIIVIPNENIYYLRFVSDDVKKGVIFDCREQKDGNSSFSMDIFFIPPDRNDEDVELVAGYVKFNPKKKKYLIANMPTEDLIQSFIRDVSRGISTFSE
jgi:hypothetical protein